MFKNISLFRLLTLSIIPIFMIIGIKFYKIKNENNNSLSLFKDNLYSITGEKIQFEGWDQKIFIVNFWTSWCKPCREEIYSFNKIYKLHQYKNISFLGIAIDSSLNLQKFLSEKKIDYPIAVCDIENGKKWMQYFGNTDFALPFTILIKNGEIKQKKLGKIDAEELNLWIESVISSS